MNSMGCNKLEHTKIISENTLTHAHEKIIFSWNRFLNQPHSFVSQKINKINETDNQSSK